MAKAQIKKKSTFIDMTAMSDVTVLLLTFFMLTSNFVKPEPIKVATPSSISDIKIPDKNILEILVTPKGEIFMNMDSRNDVQNVLERMTEQYSISLSQAEKAKFISLPNFGVPMSTLKTYLASYSGPELDAEMIKLGGIPADSAHNEFKDWVKYAREVNPDIRIAIKADASTPYKTIKNVMNSLQDLRENRYNLITALKDAPIIKP